MESLPEVLRTAKVAIHRSFWTLTGSPSLLAHPDLLALAKTLGASPAQTLYKFAQAEGIVPLSGTTTETHMRDDIAVEDMSFHGQDVDVRLKSLRGLVGV